MKAINASTVFGPCVCAQFLLFTEFEVHRQHGLYESYSNIINNLYYAVYIYIHSMWCNTQSVHVYRHYVCSYNILYNFKCMCICVSEYPILPFSWWSYIHCLIWVYVKMHKWWTRMFTGNWTITWLSSLGNNMSAN